jgi:hypothetical protein
MVGAPNFPPLYLVTIDNEKGKLFNWKVYLTSAIITNAECHPGNSKLRDWADEIEQLEGFVPLGTKPEILMTEWACRP